MSQQRLSLPPISALRSASLTAQTDALDLLFEPSPAMHEVLVPVVQAADHGSYAALVDACRSQLETLPLGRGHDATLLAVLASHPRLGAKGVDSAQSAAEQANLAGEGEELAALNAEYEARFPGLRYVVFVNGRGRPEIMRDMRARIDEGDYAKEVGAALQAMCDIAKDRASKLPVQEL